MSHIESETEASVPETDEAFIELREVFLPFIGGSLFEETRHGALLDVTLIGGERIISVVPEKVIFSKGGDKLILVANLHAGYTVIEASQIEAVQLNPYHRISQVSITGGAVNAKPLPFASTPVEPLLARYLDSGEREMVIAGDRNIDIEYTDYRPHLIGVTPIHIFDGNQGPILVVKDLIRVPMTVPVRLIKSITTHQPDSVI